MQEIDAEVIVVDNNSVDESCKMIKNKFSWVILIENDTNKGFSKANNQGAAIAKGKYICILNPDIVVRSKTFVQLINMIDQLPDSGIVGPKLIDGTGLFLNDCKRNIPSPLTSLRRLFGIRLGNVKSYYAKHIGANEIGYVDALSGACLLIKKDHYFLIDGFDEDYFLCGEDIDLCYVLKKKGFQNYYIGNAVAIHYRAESTGRNATYVRQFYGAMRIFYKKHFRSNRFIDIMISIAIRFVAFVLTLQDYTKEKQTVGQFYLVSKDQDLYEKLKAVLPQNIEKISIETFTNLGDQNIEIIFDNNFIAFDDIVDQMQKRISGNVTYKIRPKNCNYIIGSDFNDGKGEVIRF